MEEKALLLDSSVLVHLARDDHFARRASTELSLRTRRNRPLISIVTVGEVKAIAVRRKWGHGKLAVFESRLSELVIVSIGPGAIVAKYAELDAFSRSLGRGIGQNDLWIAATAAAAGAVVVTADRDFEHLVPEQITWVLLDANSGAVLEQPTTGV